MKLYFQPFYVIGHCIIQVIMDQVLKFLFVNFHNNNRAFICRYFYYCSIPLLENIPVIASVGTEKDHIVAKCFSVSSNTTIQTRVH